MSNSFLFIIPLTPCRLLTENRKKLRSICLKTLTSQTYPNWKALLIGSELPDGFSGGNFIHLSYEGYKEEKLQKATQYILSNPLKPDYIIRLDDDDIFNPELLDQLKNLTFDLYVDKYHTFWNSSDGSISQKIFYWFPNTCIHKAEHALQRYGNLPPGNYERFKTNALLIENEHNDFHKYYTIDHKIRFSSKQDPVYLRALNPDSITSIEQVGDFKNYLDRHGYRKKNNLPAFRFLNGIVSEKTNGSLRGQGLLFLIRQTVQNIRALLNYNKVVLYK